MFTKKCFMCDSKQRRSGRLMDYSFHRFPSNPLTRAEWLKFCNLHNAEDLSKLRLCSKHFAPHHFVNNVGMEMGGRIKLRPGAIPTILHPNTPPSSEAAVTDARAQTETIEYIKEEPLSVEDAAVEDIAANSKMFKGKEWRLLDMANIDNRWNRFTCNSYPPEKYKCEKCRFESDLKILQTQHFNIIHKREEIHHCLIPIRKNCKNCDFETYSSLVLLSHHNRCAGNRNHIFQTSQSENDSQSERTKKIRRFQCDHCSHKTTTKMLLKQHVLYKHTPPEQINWFACDQCRYRAKMKQKLRVHALVRHSQPAELEKIKRFECSHCSFKATQKVNLQAHTRRVHTPSEQIDWFKCEQCVYKSKDKNNLQRHIRTRHEQVSNEKKVRRFECSHCSYKATSASNLRRHVLMKHTPEDEINWIKCEYCPLKFKMKDKLRRHLRTQHKKPTE